MKASKVKSKLHKFWKEWRLTICIILFIIIPVKSSIADWNWVPTGSMKPTILEGDLIFVNKLAYDLRIPLTTYRIAKWSDPQRGDIVICFSPEDNTRLVKRVIAVPGDKIQVENNVVFLNDKPLEYSQPDEDLLKILPADEQSEFTIKTEALDELTHLLMTSYSKSQYENYDTVIVPQCFCFVMGDNRDYSKDSRAFGFVPRKSIVGKAGSIIISFDITSDYSPRLERFFKSIR